MLTKNTNNGRFRKADLSNCCSNGEEMEGRLMGREARTYRQIHIIILRVYLPE
jgi:hypothetical protein